MFVSNLFFYPGGAFRLPKAVQKARRLVTDDWLWPGSVLEVLHGVLPLKAVDERAAEVRVVCVATPTKESQEAQGTEAVAVEDARNTGAGRGGACGDAQADEPAGQGGADCQAGDDATDCGHGISSLKDHVPGCLTFRAGNVERRPVGRSCQASC